MPLPSKGFTYPFRYTPDPLVQKAALELTKSRDLSIFLEGKMLGVLITDCGPLYAFSGLAGGQSQMEGFVPPIFDYSRPGGEFRLREAEISAMPIGPLRSKASAELQDWLFRQYKVLNARGESSSIKDIFAERGIVPPGGTGECAAPKLLNYAYLQGLRPISMGEFWFGASPVSEVREQGRFYPACFGKCGPLLTFMMQGLDVEANPLDKGYFKSSPEVLYDDSDIIVVSKPFGMLSVPGRTGAVSMLEWLQERYGEIHSCHRLDMDTSGVMVFARNLPAKVEMERQFSSREIVKTYRARLSASPKPFRHALKGTIALPLAPDWYDRPRQMVDDVNGKLSVTKYEILEIFADGEMEVRFTPLTGRSHQLRVHSAHIRGLGRPIKGDCLYGDPNGGRLFLHAETIRFRHPVSGDGLFFCDEPEI